MYYRPPTTVVSNGMGTTVVSTNATPMVTPVVASPIMATPVISPVVATPVIATPMVTPVVAAPVVATPLCGAPVVATPYGMGYGGARFF
uniref:PPE family domain protein n=1 Tax=Caenorhabditis tropicalis TaxID=1561998 RepID=A0A1I7TMS6_9PELO